MSIPDFIDRYKKDMPALKVLGSLINESILAELKSIDVDVEMFLKIPPVPRSKSIDSMVSKAFYRSKSYVDPYEDITDKIGLRYVVLLRDDIAKIAQIIENLAGWSHSKDRDFEEERDRNPLTFDYQSVHYIMRNEKALTVDEIEIPENTPCEIQIRTLLQHANSELTHDTIYKPKTSSLKSIQRSVAKSMALIETTDDLFISVNQQIKDNFSRFQQLFDLLKKKYKEFAELDYDEKVNMFLIDAFSTQLSLVKEDELERYIIEKSTLFRDIILRKRGTAFLYRQPVILLIYFQISKFRERTRQLWPLPGSELRPLFIDLGISFDQD